MYDLATLKNMVTRATDMTEQDRQKSEKARDYYSGDQISPARMAEMKKRKMPPIVNNLIVRKVDAMVGIEQQRRTDPRAFPRTPMDEQSADVATKSLVYVDDTTRFDAKRSGAFENLLVEGYGGVEVVVEEKRGQFDVVVNRLRWEDIFYDPYSREKDFSDATFLGVMRWQTLDQAEELYGPTYEGEGTLDDVLQATMDSVPQSYNDRPDDKAGFSWADPKQKRVRVAQMYYQQKGVWYLSIFTGGGILYEGESPYLDEDGKPECPIILMTAYVDRENRRFGIVESLIPMQDEVNARRQRLLQLALTRQATVVKGATDASILKRQLADPDAVIEIDPDMIEGAAQVGAKPFEIIPQMDQVQAQFQLLQESKESIDKLGPNAALLGQLGGQQSGRAIMAQQNAGMAELAPIYDSLRDWTLRCYRAMWARIKQFWTEERYVRVTDELEAPQFVGLNVNRGWGLDPNTLQLMPQIENNVGTIDVDIIIDDAPDMVTLQQEQFDQLAKMASSGVPIPPEVLIEASSLRDKKRLIDLMEQAKQEAMQAQAGQVQAQQQAEQQKYQNDTLDTQSQAAVRGAQARKYDADAAKTQFEIRQAQTSTAIAAAMGVMPQTAAGL
ncbi:hypothetical protein RM190_04900 [Paracoccus sp. CPCC 101403]|uniref:Portal protein n=1 Tax=Paracoccus broussonetiae TaxID=3075834 RepID=A0ABU3EAE3_9RHOB|nr:hypothetical protein [Paracoccus sp. CPCC 101403]MDT1061187.1 hypothetical protein [Paracoccus sp. CPCC 101403]